MVHGVAKSQTRLTDFTFNFHFHTLEKEMATHPSVLAWRIPGTAEPGGLPSMGSHRVRHDWSNLAAAACIKSIKYKCKIYQLKKYYPVATTEIMRQNIVSIHKIPFCLLEFSSSTYHMACDNTDLLSIIIVLPFLECLIPCFICHTVCC